jgi:hypothetical protein
MTYKNVGLIDWILLYDGSQMTTSSENEGLAEDHQINEIDKIQQYHINDILKCWSYWLNISF